MNVLKMLGQNIKFHDFKIDGSAVTMTVDGADLAQSSEWWKGVIW